MSKKKLILILIPVILISALVARVTYVNIDQNNEFEYHGTLQNSIEIWSNDFEPNGTIPIGHTDLGENVSPSLFWDNIPPETKSLVITAVDYDGPSPNFRLMTIDHWSVYNIDPAVRHIDKGAAPEELEGQGMSQGLNVYNEAGYIGPDPPMGVHKYYFRIYALSAPSLDLAEPTRSELMENMKDHIIAYGELIGTFGS